MQDIGKIADLVLLMIDASFGFEMETFEFLNILQVHGFPKVMGVLTHLDSFRDSKRLKKTKKALKQRFWTEIAQGAKLFYLSGMVHGQYLKNEVHNLSLYISRMKFRPLTWRGAHPHVLVDRYEDITAPALVQADARTNRRVVMFGYLRGTNMRQNTTVCRAAVLGVCGIAVGDARWCGCLPQVHIAGAGDFVVQSVRALDDPCPLPERDPEKKNARKSLNNKETMLYAPMANIGALRFDSDAVYIDLPEVNFTRKEAIVPDGHNERIDVEGVDRENGDSDSDDVDVRSVDLMGDESGGWMLHVPRVRGAVVTYAVPADADNEMGIKLVKSLQAVSSGIDERLQRSSMSLFKQSKPVADEDAADWLLNSNGGAGTNGAGSSDDSSSDDSSSGDSDSDSEDSDGAAPVNPAGVRMPREEVDTDKSGRTRRRAVFHDAAGAGGGAGAGAGASSGASSGAAAGEARWKEGLAQRALQSLRDRRSGRVNLMELVYGTSGLSLGDDDAEDGHGAKSGLQGAIKFGVEGGESDSDSDEELFKIRPKTAAEVHGDKVRMATQGGVCLCHSPATRAYTNTLLWSRPA